MNLIAKLNLVIVLFLSLMNITLANTSNTSIATSEEIATETITTTTVKTKQVLKSEPIERKKVAIYVRNDSSDKDLDKHLKNLEYALSARINNLGFGVINHELVLRNLNTYLQDPNSKYKKEASHIKNNIKEDSLDMKLFENASGLRIAEFIGADYILCLSISNFGVEKRIFKGYGVETVNLLYNLRCNYNLCEAGGATGTAGGDIKSSQTYRQTQNLIIESNDVINSLIDDTANQMSVLLNKQNKENQIIAKEDTAGEIKIVYQIEAMSFPELIKVDGGYQVGTQAIPATIAYVNAEIDGVTQTLGTTISLSKGIHTLKINQKDIEPIERNIFVTGQPNQTIAFNLQLTQEARNRWKTDMKFIENMKEKYNDRENKRMLTEAEAEKLRSIGKMYEQSGFKVDSKALPETVIKTLY